MTFFTAIVVYGDAEKKRVFVDCENALKWLYSHGIGQYYINGIEYTRETIRSAL